MLRILLKFSGLIASVSDPGKKYAANRTMTLAPDPDFRRVLGGIRAYSAVGNIGYTWSLEE